MIFFSFIFFVIYIFKFSLSSYNSYRLYNNLTNLTYYYELINKCYNPKIIASLTTYKTRLPTINNVIDSILDGILKPDKIILTLYYKDYYSISKK